MLRTTRHDLIRKGSYAQTITKMHRVSLYLPIILNLVLSGWFELMVLGAIICYPTYWEIITRTETVFDDLKHICRSASIIAPKSGNANGIQLVFKVGGMLGLDKIEIDANVYRWVTRNLSKQKLNGHRLKSTAVSEDVKPEDALPGTARASKLEFETEVYVSNGP